MEVIYFDEKKSIEDFIKSIKPNIFYNFPLEHLFTIVNKLDLKSNGMKWYLNSKGNFILYS